jgi:hypothetical protein
VLAAAVPADKLSAADSDCRHSLLAQRKDGCYKISTSNYNVTQPPDKLSAADSGCRHSLLAQRKDGCYKISTSNYNITQPPGKLATFVQLARPQWPEQQNHRRAAVTTVVTVNLLKTHHGWKSIVSH